MSDTFRVRFHLQRSKEFLFARPNDRASLPASARLLRPSFQGMLLSAHFDFEVTRAGRVLRRRWSPVSGELQGCLWATGIPTTDQYIRVMARTARLIPIIESRFGPDIPLPDGQAILCTVTLEGL